MYALNHASWIPKHLYLRDRNLIYKPSAIALMPQAIIPILTDTHPEP